MGGGLLGAVATISIILLVFAGLIEGLFSADPYWPFSTRVAVGALTGVLMILWLTRGWRRARGWRGRRCPRW